MFEMTESYTLDMFPAPSLCPGLFLVSPSVACRKPFLFPAAVGFRALRMFAPPGLHPRAVYLCQHSAGGENTRPKQAGYHGWPTVWEEALQLLTDSYLRGGYYTAVNTLDSCVLISLCTATVWNKRTFF